VIRLSKIRKGFRLLKCKALGQPLDPELRHGVDIFKLSLRVWWSSITRQRLDVRLHHEFNLWAEKGVGEGMDNPHRRIIELTVPKMELAANDRILDLACGAGLASRLMASVNSTSVVGMDISDGMLRHARNQSVQFQNINFTCGSAERVPFPDNFFTKVLSVEAFYYFEHQDRVLAELQRVLAPHGRLFLLICLYSDHKESLATVDSVDVPVHVRSIAEYKAILEQGGWIDISSEEFIREPQPGRKSDVHDRALLLTAHKPGVSVLPAAQTLQATGDGVLFESLT